MPKIKKAISSIFSNQPHPVIGENVWFGFFVIFLFFGIGAIWAITAPINTAAVAIGKVIVEEKQREMQHLDGGIVKELYIKEGRIVKQNDLLIVLDDTRINASLNLLIGDLYALQATEARLIAERDEKDVIIYPESFDNVMNNIETKKIVKGQQDIFNTNRLTLQKLNLKYDNQILAQELAVEGGLKQIQADKQRIFYLSKEYNAIKQLVDKGKIEENLLWESEGNLSQVKGDMFEHEKDLANTKNSIIETELRKLTELNQRQLSIVNELRKTQREIAQTIQQINGVKDQLLRTKIYSPIAGSIVNLEVNTIGEVIRPGETFLNIVPLNDELIIEVRIKQNDIDVVYSGLETHVKLSAYNTRYLPDLVGELKYVSADTFLDEKTGEIYYQGRVKVPQSEFDKVKGLKMYPGMQAEVMIITDKRTFYEYFISPIRNSLNRAFREQ